MKPALERAVCAALRIVLGVAEPVLELDQPVRGVFTAFEQRIDQQTALLGVRASKKLFGLLGRGQDADCVEIDPPQKGSVVTERKRFDVDAAQLAKYVLVDQVAGCRLSIGRVGHIIDDDELRCGGLTHSAGHHCRDTRALGHHRAIRVHHDDRLVVDRIVDFAGHVPRCAVGEPPHDDEGLVGIGSHEDTFPGVHLQPFQTDGGRSVWYALAQPRKDRPVLVRCGCQEMAPTVGYAERRLSE